MKLLFLIFLPFLIIGQTIDTVTVIGSPTLGFDQPSTQIRYNKFPGDSLNVSGTLISLGLQRKEAGGTITFRFAIYTDNSGAPGDLIDSTEVLATNQVGWFDLDLINGTTVTAGTSYWIAIKNNGTQEWYGVASGYANHMTFQTTAYATGWPASATPDTYFAFLFNARLIISVPAVLNEKKPGFTRLTNQRPK